jgi:hypothetical protein
LFSVGTTAFYLAGLLEDGHKLTMMTSQDMYELLWMVDGGVDGWWRGKIVPNNVAPKSRQNV